MESKPGFISVRWDVWRRDLRTPWIQSQKLPHQVEKLCNCIFRFLLCTSEERWLQEIDGKSVILGMCQIVFVCKCSKPFSEEDSNVVHACTSCPADVTCSVPVTGNAASDSFCLYIFVTQVHTQTRPAHTVWSRSVGVCEARGGEEGLSSIV